MAVAQNAPQLSRLPNMDPNYERPRSGTARGVHITQLDETRINPQPVSLEESDMLLEQYLSPSKLRLLAGVDDLNDVTSLEMKVDTTETSLGNFGALLPNLKQLKLSDSIINGIRDIGSSLRNLKVLWLCRCGLKELDGVASLTSLKELYLSYNDITDISPISMIDTLEILDLEGNYIDDVGQIQYLTLCQSLKSLSLEGNPVCLMPHPNSSQTDYNYRESVRKVLPRLQILDEEPLGDGSACSRKPNVFEDDWAYLEELQKDALLLESLVDTVNIGTESGSRPGTAALRPATAFRPGTSMRRPPTAFRPQSGRPVSGGSRPATTARPATAVRPTTSALRPESSDSSEVDATSDLTLGNVICGLPSRALKNRKKIGKTKEEEMERDKQRLIKESAAGGRDSSRTVGDTEEVMEEARERDLAFQQEMQEWRQHHEKRMEVLEKERAPQVLVIDHNGLSDSSLTDEEENEDSEEEDDVASSRRSFLSIQAGKDKSASGKSHEHYRSSFRGLKHDESFEADEDEDPVRSYRRSPSPSLRLHSRRSQSPIPSSLIQANGRQLPTPPSTAKLSARLTETSVVTTATGLPAPVIRTVSHDGSSPPTSAGNKLRGSIPPPVRMRRQLPEVPSLPSKPPVPKS